MEGIETLAMACSDSTCNFKPIKLHRRPLGPEDVEIDIKFCGVCHTDLHTAANHVAGVQDPTQYPCVPGHEIAGVCVRVGDFVSKVKVGDKVGVGYLVDSCHRCKHCKHNNEQKCKKRTDTFNGKIHSKRAATYPTKRNTLGGYSNKMVVHEHFVISIPESMPLEYAGPLMCAGVTTYTPLKKYGVKSGSKVGIIGLGGLGVLGIKLASALGAEVTAISRSNRKREKALGFGADNFLASSDSEAMRNSAKSLDIVLNTIPAAHDWTVYQRLLRKGGKHILIGVHAGYAGAMMANRVKDVSVKSAFIGGVENTQEVVNLCAKNEIYPQIELIPVQQLNSAFSALDSSNDSGKRYVLDLESLKEDILDNYNASPANLGPNETSLNYSSVAKQMFRILFFY